MPSKETSLNYTENPSLSYTAVPEDWKGTPQLSDGTYQNLYYPFESSLWEVLKWKLSKNPYSDQKKKDDRTLEIQPMKTFQPNGKDQLIWLGHASFLIHLNGITLITDPVWLDNWVLKRNSELPIDPKELKNIDYILISHDHRDHCDEETIKRITSLNPEVKILAGLNMKPLIQDWTSNSISIEEAGWFQQFNTGSDLKITFVPARHWSRRGLSDTNLRLWGGFYLETAAQSIYFMGDSGYGPHFKLISETLGSPDYALMGVGAFRPEWFMNAAHTNPQDAGKAFIEMKGKHFIPMHFGTFDLSDEPLLEPLDILTQSPKLTDHRLITPILGENLFQNPTP
ncbi:MBL fold metallo-hydrolase [Algoriphagus sp.]|uniref:MBL fold metallo-hydrolase n=1 Tax=Algoriphagus sp. TaxID=1872435 RepID=UPI00261755C9|nr:MBL fold metallo-hydrolase [Algoriphagus sp.]